MTESLECPCCGEEGSLADRNGYFYDEDPLVCDCPGWVCVDEDGECWINNGDAICEKCAGLSDQAEGR